MSKKINKRKSVLALLIPGHNEELVIQDTIISSISAGMIPEDIFVVDDCSSDTTAKLARELIPKNNVLTVDRSGKGLAIKKAGKHFELASKYRWIHVSDADGKFGKDYFKIMRRELRVKNAAGTGYIRSQRGKTISQYRVFEYTVGMEIHRRIQSLFGVIPIIPGPTSVFRSDVFNKVDFHSSTLTEDFDVTMQIYRQKLGKIQYIKHAVTYTQDPRDVKQFAKQITRWNRGVLQVMAKHKVSRHISPVDIYLNYQVLQNMLFFVNFFIWIPYLSTTHVGPSALAIAFLYDVAITFALVLFSAIRVNRWDALAAFPHIYALRWLSLGVFLKSFIEIVVLRKFRTSKGTWDNGANRRYKQATNS